MITWEELGEISQVLVNVYRGEHFAEISVDKTDKNICDIRINKKIAFGCVRTLDLKLSKKSENEWVLSNLSLQKQKCERSFSDFEALKNFFNDHIESLFETYSVLRLKPFS